MSQRQARIYFQQLHAEREAASNYPGRKQRLRRTLGKEEKQFLESRFLSRPQGWDTNITKQIAFILNISRKKVSQWRWLRARREQSEQNPAETI